MFMKSFRVRGWRRRWRCQSPRVLPSGRRSRRCTISLRMWSHKSCWSAKWTLRRRKKSGNRSRRSFPFLPTSPRRSIALSRVRMWKWRRSMTFTLESSSHRKCSYGCVELFSCSTLRARWKRQRATSSRSRCFRTSWSSSRWTFPRRTSAWSRWPRRWSWRSRRRSCRSMLAILSLDLPFWSR